MPCENVTRIRTACVSAGVPPEKINSCMDSVKKAIADELLKEKKCSYKLWEDCLSMVECSAYDRGNRKLISIPPLSKDWEPHFTSYAKRFANAIAPVWCHDYGEDVCRGFYLNDAVPVVWSSVQTVLENGRRVYKLEGKEELMSMVYDKGEGFPFCLTLTAVVKEGPGQPEARVLLDPISEIAGVEDIVESEDFGTYMYGKTDVVLPWHYDVVRYELWGVSTYAINRCPGTRGGPWSSKKAKEFSLELLLTVGVVERIADPCATIGASSSLFCRSLYWRADLGIKTLTGGEDFATIRKRVLKAAKKHQ